MKGVETGLAQGCLLLRLALGGGLALQSRLKLFLELAAVDTKLIGAAACGYEMLPLPVEVPFNSDSGETRKGRT